MQGNSSIMTDKLAKCFLKIGLAKLLAADDMPNLREGAARVLHKHGFVDGVKCISCK